MLNIVVTPLKRICGIKAKRSATPIPALCRPPRTSLGTTLRRGILNLWIYRI